MAALHSTWSFHRSLDASPWGVEFPPMTLGGSDMYLCCVSVGTRFGPGRAPALSRRSHPDSPEWPSRYEPA